MAAMAVRVLRCCGSRCRVTSPYGYQWPNRALVIGSANAIASWSILCKVKGLKWASPPAADVNTVQSGGMV